MPEYNLYLAGKDDTPYANEIKQRIINENISNVFVTSTIRQQEKIWFYNHCYAFVFPSLFEGFGLPIIEALSFGKPVISSQETSLKEIGSDKVFFLDNFEAEHIANVIKTKSQYFYEHPELAQRDIEYANSFSYRKHMERYIEIYREMLCDARQK
jgi:glycosyltransferase involved in cell wall biosynthesis